MNTAVRLKIEMAIRVRDFLRANPFGVANADQLAAEFTEKVTRAITLLDQQTAGNQAVAGSVQQRSELRRKIRKLYLYQVIRVARAAALVAPDLTQHCRMPGRGGQLKFLSESRTCASVARTHEAVLEAHGLLPGVLDQLDKALDEYEGLIEQANAGRRAHTGATMELRTLSSELARIAGRLDAMVRYTFRDRADLIGAWTSARNVAWPIQPDEVKPAA